MRQASDSDVEFRVDLGRTFSGVKKIELQHACIENKFLNFYQSTKGDFRDFSFRIGDQTYSIQADIFLTIDNISEFLLRKTSVALSVLYENETTFPDPGDCLIIKSETLSGITLLGFGWTKIGFEQGAYVFVSKKISALRLPDFAQPPLALIEIQQFAAGLVLKPLKRRRRG